MTWQETAGLQNIHDQVFQQSFRTKLSWALLRDVGWAQPGRAPLCPRGTVGSGDGGKPGTELMGGHARCLAAGPAFTISICSPSTNFRGESEAHHGVCVVFLSLFWAWNRWDFSEQILLSTSTATLQIQIVSTWRIDLLRGEGKSSVPGAALSPSL